jgi:hypothetical protein
VCWATALEIEINFGELFNRSFAFQPSTCRLRNFITFFFSITTGHRFSKYIYEHTHTHTQKCDATQPGDRNWRASRSYDVFNCGLWVEVGKTTLLNSTARAVTKGRYVNALRCAHVTFWHTAMATCDMASSNKHSVSQLKFHKITQGYSVSISIIRQSNPEPHSDTT